MDFIFEEDMDEVGSDIEAYCPKCKADTAHTVITKYEEEVRRVQCSTCGDVHAYRKPRGEVEDESPEPVAAKKRAAAKKPSWQEAADKAGNKHMSHARPYTIRDRYHEGDIVSHPKFGVGFVTEISENKAEITFQDERRVLVHNRPDLAAQMPAIAPVPAPREEKIKGKRGKKGAPIAVAQMGKSAGKPPALAPAKGAVAAVVPAPAVAGALKGKSAAPVVVAGKKAPAAPVVLEDVKKKVAAAAPPARKDTPPVKKPTVPSKPVAVQGKAARAQAAAKKKGAAKGKVPAAKPAARPAKPAAAARTVRPAARATRPEPAKGKLKKKAR
jgi:hypothetical protein